MRILLVLLFLVSFDSHALDPVEIVYKTDEIGRKFKRERRGYKHDSRRKIIRIYYMDWVEYSDGSIDVKPTEKVYKLSGSYYYELSLATSGDTRIGDFLDSLIDARLGSTADHIQSSIEAGRSAKDAAMIPLGYTP